MLKFEDIVENNPILGLTGEELEAVNAKYLPLQSTLRKSMMMGIMGGGDPGLTLAASLHGMAMMACALENAEAVGYMIALAEGIKHTGPEALLHGELTLGGVFKPGEVPDEIKQKFGLTDEDAAKPGAEVKIVREGNVIDASDAFTKGRDKAGGEYDGGGMGFKIPPRDKLH